LREDFLQQSAYHPIDRYCPLNKAYWMLRVILDFYHRTQSALEADIRLERITSLPVIDSVARMKELQVNEAEETIKALLDRIRFSFEEFGVE